MKKLKPIKVTFWVPSMENALYKDEIEVIKLNPKNSIFNTLDLSSSSQLKEDKMKNRTVNIK